MTDINIMFCRRMLQMAHENIRRAFPGIQVSKAASWVGPHGRNQYFVQIHTNEYPPFDDYYSAGNAYDAKAQAWNAFFEKHAPEQVKREIEAEDNAE